jgi:hypothetical protein
LAGNCEQPIGSGIGDGPWIGTSAGCARGTAGDCANGDQLYRNGSWYDSKRAQAHLRGKYEMLAAADRINTAEDFIEKAATKSSLSGRPYQVKCRGSEAVTSNQWLRDVLARYRTSGAHNAPRVLRGALATDGSRFKTRSLVVLSDCELAVDRLHSFGLTRDRGGLV